MEWDLPKSVKIDNQIFKITDDCDYRMVLDCWNALEDEKLEINERLTCALCIFYDDFEAVCQLEKDNVVKLAEKMKDIINGDNQQAVTVSKKSNPIVNFNKDFPLIVTAMLPILGYDIREKEYLHWWTFLGAFREINSGVYAEVLRIRAKLSKGISLEKNELQFYRENKSIVDIDHELTEEEKEFLFSD